jgi:hypothetical protein
MSLAAYRAEFKASGVGGTVPAARIHVKADCFAGVNEPACGYASRLFEQTTASKEITLISTGKQQILIPF